LFLTDREVQISHR